MKNLEHPKILILGLGFSGLALARWCSRYGAQVTVADTRSEPPQLAVLQTEMPEARFVSSALDQSLLLIDSFDAVFKSPGLSPEAIAGLVAAAQVRALPVGNELALFAQALEHLKSTDAYAPHVIAITGTNGKTTVTSLTGQLAERAGRTVAVAGNIGPSMLDT